MNHGTRKKTRIKFLDEERDRIDREFAPKEGFKESFNQLDILPYSQHGNCSLM